MQNQNNPDPGSTPSQQQADRRFAWLLLIGGILGMIFALPGAAVLFILVKAWLSMS